MPANPRDPSLRHSTNRILPARLRRVLLREMTASRRWTTYTVSGRSARVGDGWPPVETGSSLQGVSMICEIIASLGNDGLEGFEVWDVFVDDGLVDGRPWMFCGLKFGV